MTLTDVFLGDEATARVAEWSAANAEAPADLAYAVALVAVVNTGTTPGTISLADFRSAGADGVLRRTPAVVVGEQAMRGLVAPGDVLEGWIPLVVDDPSVATLWFESTTSGGSWGTAIFGLAPSSSVPAFTIPSDSLDAGTSPETPAELGQSVLTGEWRITLERTLVGQDIYDMARGLWVGDEPRRPARALFLADAGDRGSIRRILGPYSCLDTPISRSHLRSAAGGVAWRLGGIREEGLRSGRHPGLRRGDDSGPAIVDFRSAAVHPDRWLGERRATSGGESRGGTVRAWRCRHGRRKPG